METVFDLAVPRDQVLHGELSPDVFAVRLKDVMDGTSDDPVYLDPDLFFDNTYPTAGLKTLLREVLDRLTGEAPTNSPTL
jgi:predicted AAA+ superfamily ATPase